LRSTVPTTTDCVE